MRAPPPPFHSTGHCPRLTATTQSPKIPTPCVFLCSAEMLLIRMDDKGCLVFLWGGGVNTGVDLNKKDQRYNNIGQHLYLPVSRWR